MDEQSEYERLVDEIRNDPLVRDDVSLGRRVSFYKIGKELGSGNFSQVKLGTHLLCREKVAIKILDKFKLENKTQKLLAREICILEKLCHPNIIRIYEVCETMSKLHIITEYCGGGELLSRISQEGKIAESDAKPIIAQLVAAMEHLHTQGIVHRDIKAENVYFSSQRTVKLGDFGFSTLSALSDTLTTCCGSPPYAAPELFKELPYVGVYVDVWALGVLLYFMVVGVMPFRADTVPKLKPIILSGRYSLPESLSEHCGFVIKNLLRLLPKERLSLDGLKHCDWLRRCDFPSSWTREAAADQQARAVMTSQYGVPVSLVDNGTQDVRNAVAGTYRLLLHQIEKKARNEIAEFKDDGYGSYNSVSLGLKGPLKGQPKKTNKQPTSSACTLL